MVALAAAAAATGAAADDQYRPGGSPPPGHTPPAGECRVWLPGRPPGQQPPPTDCRRAQADAARLGGQVVQGGDSGRDRGDRRWDDDRRAPRDDDDVVRVCVRRDWHGHCLRSEIRRR
jgi:hypothetical protein